MDPTRQDIVTYIFYVKVREFNNNVFDTLDIINGKPESNVVIFRFKNKIKEYVATAF